MTSPPTIFTIGYQGRSVEALCQALTDAGVEQLIDVRARAWSNRPEYRKTALQAALRRHGIEYVHCKEAGNPHRPKPGEERAWTECRDRYRDHLRQNPSVIRIVAGLVGDRPSALFCYEAATGSCHRGELLKAMKRRHMKVTVIDL